MMVVYALITSPLEVVVRTTAIGTKELKHDLSHTKKF